MPIRKPGKKRVAVTCLILLSVIGLKEAIERFGPKRELMVEQQIAGCLPWELYHWMDRERNGQDFKRYDLITFPARNMKPFFQDGTPIGKMVVGMPGDTVEIKNGNLTVNGVLLGDTAYGAKRLKKPLNYWDKRYVLGQDEIFVFGSEANSYDSRYWGPYPKHLVRGRIDIVF